MSLKKVKSTKKDKILPTEGFAFKLQLEFFPGPPLCQPALQIDHVLARPSNHMRQFLKIILSPYLCIDSLLLLVSLENPTILLFSEISVNVLFSFSNCLTVEFSVFTYSYKQFLCRTEVCRYLSLYVAWFFDLFNKILC